MLLARRGRLSGERQQRPGETVGLAAQLANAMCAGQRGGMQEDTAGSWKAHAIRSEKNVYFTLPGFRVAITSASPGSGAASAMTSAPGSITLCISTAASAMNTPPAITAARRSLLSTWFITQPKPSEAMISGSTMKKLKMPMYTPVCSAGNEPASTEYGMASVLAHAIPTPAIDNNNKFLS